MFLVLKSEDFQLEYLFCFQGLSSLTDLVPVVHWSPPKKLDSKLSLLKTIKFTDMTRRKFTSKFKTKVALEAIKEQKSLSELAEKFDLHPNQISQWKREFLNNAENVFDSGKPKSKKTEAEEREEGLLKMIDQQKVELDFLKKALSWNL